MSWKAGEFADCIKGSLGKLIKVEFAPLDLSHCALYSLYRLSRCLLGFYVWNGPRDKYRTALSNGHIPQRPFAALGNLLSNVQQQLDKPLHRLFEILWRNKRTIDP
jgi:hypothetical protein